MATVKPADRQYRAARGLNYIPAGFDREVRVEAGDLLELLPPVAVLEREIADGTVVVESADVCTPGNAGDEPVEE